MRVPPVVLSIAGYDPSSGAGVTADVKTAAALGCYAATCITAITVQSTLGVFDVQPLNGELVVQILRSLAEDLEIRAIRLGMLGSGEVAAAVADFLESARLPNVVLDPVLRSSSGMKLLDEWGLQTMRKRLIPLCDVLTPNIHEAAVLVGSAPFADQSDWESALPRLRELSARIHRLGAKAVVITGGHLDPANDYLSYQAGEKADVIAGGRVESRSTHGTGCAYATAIACRLALGDDLPRAATAAKDTCARDSVGVSLGKGNRADQSLWVKTLFAFPPRLRRDDPSGDERKASSERSSYWATAPPAVADYPEVASASRHRNSPVDCSAAEAPTVTEAVPTAAAPAADPGPRCSAGWPVRFARRCRRLLVIRQRHQQASVWIRGAAP